MGATAFTAGEAHRKKSYFPKVPKLKNGNQHKALLFLAGREAEGAENLRKQMLREIVGVI